MTELTLAPTQFMPDPLEIGPCRLSAFDRPLVSIAVPHDGETEFAEKLDALGLSWPEIGRASMAAQSKLMRLGGDHAMLVGPTLAEADAALGGVSWLTDQSDAWIGFRLEGTGAAEALAYLSPLDLSDTVFPDGACTRSAMAHMAVMLLRRSAKDWTLWTPRSSASSYLGVLAEALRLATTGRPSAS